MTNLPYTQLVIDKIIKEITKSSIEPIISSNNPEFIAGAEYQKKEILKTIKSIKF